MLEEMLDVMLFTSLSCLTHDEQIIENRLIFLSLNSHCFMLGDFFMFVSVVCCS